MSKLVNDIMIRKVYTVMPSDSVKKAVKIMRDHQLDGLPVVNRFGVLVGLITQNNLITDEKAIHVPTLIALLDEFELYRRDRKLMKKEIDNILSMKVEEVMNPAPPHIYGHAPVETAAMALSANHDISPLPVVDTSRILVGVVTRFEIFSEFSVSSNIEHKYAKQSLPADKEITDFLNTFERTFILMSRFRARSWIAANVAFFIAGIIVMIALSLRITIN